MKKTKTLSTAAALGVVAALAGAPAGLAAETDAPRITPPDIAFPADKIEHRVVKHCATPTGWHTQTVYNGCLIAHEYITSDRNHEVWRDAATGELIAENATVNSTIFSWTKKANTLNVGKSRRPNKPSAITLEAEGAVNREAVARGWMRVEREEVRDGRAGVVLVETEAAPTDDSTSEYFVDPTTYHALERKLNVVMPPNPRGVTGGFSATDTLVSVEQLPRTAENERLLVMADKPGVAVREVEGEDEVIAAAARKAGFKAKTRAKIAAKAKARAGKKAGSRKARRS